VANRTGCGLKKQLNSPNSKLQAKYMLHKAIIRPIVGYGIECWTLTKEEENMKND
jgi:hypothetical protein